MNRRLALGGLAALSLSACSTTRTVPTGLQAGKQQRWQLDGIALKNTWLSLPAGYSERAEPWPLLIFLHGSGERGTDLDAVLRHGPPMHVAKGQVMPLILCSPQLPNGQVWDPAQLHELLLALRARLNVDPRRCLGTGLSLGGHGMWNWASSFPDDLAAIAPVCGYGDPARVPAMRRVPVRAYHGDADTVVPIARQQACVDALRAAGGTVSFTIYPGGNHGAWVPAYQDPELLPWLLAQRSAA